MKALSSTGLFYLFSFLFAINATFSWAQESDRTLYNGQFAPEFSVKDVDGKYHSIEQYKGKKILLSFYRYAACPVCNTRFHELENEHEFFQKNGIILLSVYESSAETLKEFIDTNHFYQTLIADPSGILYKLYGVEISKGKVVKGMTNGALQKSNAGKKLFTKKLKKDGNSNRIPADFLIDENGNIINAYYGKYLGDRMPVEYIKSQL